MSLGINTLETQSFKNLFLGDANLIKTFDYTAGASLTLTAGCPVAVTTADGKLCKYNSEGSDGSQNLIGILMEDFTTGASDTVIVKVAVVCEVNKAVVDTAFDSAFTAGVYNYGNIIIRSIA